MHYHIRPLDDNSDLASIARIYRDSIVHLGDRAYSPEQIAAWSSYPEDDPDAFQSWITEATTFVAADSQNVPIGFGGLEEPGLIASLFVAPEAMRTGVGSALLEHLLADLKARGIAGATAKASEFSKPLFEKFGFRMREVEQVEFKGVAFTRYAMERCS